MTDLHLAIRSLGKNSSFTATALLTLILGIGATTSIFSIVYAVLFRPLPYTNAKSLIHVVADDPTDSHSGVPLLLYTTLQKQPSSIQQIAVYYRNTGFSRVIVGGLNEPESVQAGFTSASLFPLLGIKPKLGRTFEDREVEHAEPVAVISNSLGQRRFGGRLNVLGQTVEVDNKPFTIIGVMPHEFQFPARETALWLPITTNRYWNEQPAADDIHSRAFFMRWNLIGRLRPGSSAITAQQELNEIASRLSQQTPAWNLGLRLKPLPLSIEIGSRPRLILLLLLAAVAVVLLIACTNVANLQLARSAGRVRELAIRSALGASQSRLMRQAFTESVVLVTIATAASLLFVQWTIPLLVRFGPADLPRLEEAKLDPAVLAFALGTSIFTAVLFGLWPAVLAGRSNPQDALKSGANRNAASRDSLASRALIVTEFAFAILLTTTAGLLLRSLWEVDNTRLGFDPGQLLTMRIQPLRQSSFDEQLHARLKSIPGVQSAGAIRALFELGSAPVNSLRAVEGQPPESRKDQPLTWTAISHDYFQAMGTPLLAGRHFSTHDTPGAPLAAIVDSAMAKRYWPTANPIGKRFKGQDKRGKNDDWITVIGVVSDARRQGVEQNPTPHVFLWHLQSEPAYDWVIRTSAHSEALTSMIRSIVHELDPNALISNVMSMDRRISMQTFERRFQTWLLSLFAMLALLLAAVGIFGVMSHSAARRTHEMAIRIAIGADRISVIRLVLRRGIGLAAAGLAIGIGLSVMAAKILGSLLYGVSPTDPIVFTTSAILLLLVAALATFFPAWRVARVDPLVALSSI